MTKIITIIIHAIVVLTMGVTSDVSMPTPGLAGTMIPITPVHTARFMPVSDTTLTTTTFMTPIIGGVLRTTPGIILTLQALLPILAMEDISGTPVMATVGVPTSTPRFIMRRL